MVHTFPKSISANVRVRLEFELVYFETAIQHFSHYATGSPSKKINIVSHSAHGEGLGNI